MSSLSLYRFCSICRDLFEVMGLRIVTFLRYEDERGIGSVLIITEGVVVYE